MDDQIFEHKRGAIPDENGRRGPLDDPPGWYFWNKGFDGQWRLYGPNGSREEAESEQEEVNT
jgi:hypothetical protein